MTYWIYSMGLPVPVRDDRLLVSREVKPLYRKVKAVKVNDMEKNVVTPVTAHSAAPKNYANFIRATQPKQGPDNRKLVHIVDDIMSTPVFTLPENTPYAKAWQQFQQHKFHHFPILNQEQKLVGMLSDRDMLAHAVLHETKEGLAQPVATLMSQSVITASLKTNIRELCQVMLSQYISALPITNDRGDLLGIVTRSDILRTMIKNEPLEFWV